MKLVISKEALNDLEQIWYYTYQSWSLQQADKYLNLIMDEMEYLAQNPQSGKNISHLRVAYFRVKVRSYYIFYRINAASNEVEIIRILHQQKAIDERLSE
jgi:toxin ParE1/3/4